MSQTDQSNAAFFSLVNALGHKNLVPDADAEDLRNGARYIPSEVTLARRRGETVKFVHSCPQKDRHWKMPDGKKIMLT